MTQLQPRILFLEHMLGFYLVIQMLLPTYFTLASSLMGFAVLTTIKYNFEGLRVNYFLFFFTQVLTLIAYSTLSRIVGLVLICIAITYFPLYHYPQPLGTHKVGYRRVDLHEETYGAVYYPTNETTKDVKYSEGVDTWQRFTEILTFYAKVRGKRTFPRVFFRLILSFLKHQYLGVNLEAKVAHPKDNKKFPIILFSHGLAANVHVYSGQIREWASHGYIVISIDHDEQIPVNIRNLNDYPEYIRLRAEQLEVRKKTLTQLLNFVSNPKNIQELFQDSDIALDPKKVFLAGHSFGGATACEVAAEDNRITGGLVLLDPWLEPCTDKIFSGPLNKPILLVRSESFENLENMKGKCMQYVKANENGKGLVISGYFKGSTHHYSSDLSIHIPREMMLFKMLKTMHNLPDHMLCRNALTHAFLDTISQEREGKRNVKTQTLKEAVLQRFRDYLKENSKEDFLAPDEEFCMEKETQKEKA